MSATELVDLTPQDVLDRLERCHAEERLLRAVLRELRRREGRRVLYHEDRADAPQGCAAAGR